MPAIQVTLRDRWACPAGTWRANGARAWRSNPPLERWRRTFAARLFVGIWVKGRPVWEPEDVLTAIEERWVGGASVLHQLGTWIPSRGAEPEPEESVQIVLLDDAGKWASLDDWTAAVIELGEWLAGVFHQDQVLYEIQDRGLVQESGLIGP